MRLWSAAILVCIASTVAHGKEISCFQGQSGDAEYQLSKADQVRDGDVRILRSDGKGLDFISTVSGQTLVETSGRKRSHRSEIRESAQTSTATLGADWQCYEFALMLPKGTALPGKGRNGKRTKLTVAQFHQERTGSVPPSALYFFDVDPRGHLIFEASERLGGKKKILARDIRDRWFEIRVAARWSTKRKEGRTLVWIRERGEQAFELIIDTKGRNSTTGHVYQKLGAYRSFLERDPAFADRTVQVHYSNIRRNGRPAAFR